MILMLHFIKLKLYQRKSLVNKMVFTGDMMSVLLRIFQTCLTHKRVC